MDNVMDDVKDNTTQYYWWGRRNPGPFRKVQLHKGNEGKPEPNLKGGQNSIVEKDNQNFKEYL